MSNWEEQEDGSYLGVASEKALAWAAGDRHKLAALGFVAWCRDFGLDPFWASDEWTHTIITKGDRVRWLFKVLLDRSEDIGCFEVEWEPDEEWEAAVVRILDGSTPLIHILGTSAVLHQHLSRAAVVPRHQLLSPREFLRAAQPKEMAA